ncbi:MAG: M55 family metallopeptidase [Anaerolineales bacterium]|nr:M55 family metallopeptidase [Anaerolineales bacterium]
MKILIAVDMEGISGVTSWDQVDPGHAEYQRFRKIMTEDVNAAVRGAFDAGADEVVIADGHWNSGNILIEQLDPRARLNSGTPSPYSMLQGIDDNIDGTFFVGYHARAGSQNAILDHTWSSRRIFNLWLNGILVGEYGLNGALCGHFNVPVLMISGDQTVCAQASELLGPLETAVVKHATSRFAAECLPIPDAQELIYQAARRGIENLKAGRTKPFRLVEPVQVTIEYASTDMADKAILLPGARRLDGRRIEFSAADMPGAYTSFRAAVNLA